MQELEKTIQQKYENILREIEAAKKRSKEAVRLVELVVVTKGHPAEVLRAAYRAGVRSFGENYPEETVEKMAALAEFENVCWHMIGHLQSRKARLVAEHFDIIESVDSLGLAVKLNERLTEFKRTLPVLLEVNVGGESSKFGFDASQPETWGDLLEPFQQIGGLANLNVRGLMTMPPIYENPEQSRPHFVQMRRLQTYLRERLAWMKWDELSMGTSYDFMVAVEEGATIVRVGTAIVGERPKKV